MYLKYSTCPPWYELTAIAWASSWNRGDDDLLDRAIVSEMDDLGARRLEDPAHDVDRRVVPVEQTRRGDETNPCGVLGGALDWGSGVGGTIDKCGLGHVSGSSPGLCVGLRRALRGRGPGASPAVTAGDAPSPSHREPAKIAG